MTRHSEEREPVKVQYKRRPRRVARAELLSIRTCLSAELESPGEQDTSVDKRAVACYDIFEKKDSPQEEIWEPLLSPE
jgi:hypothetical protein